jgi:hypothetical protein
MLNVRDRQVLDKVADALTTGPQSAQLRQSSLRSGVTRICRPGRKELYLSMVREVDLGDSQ